MKHHDLMSGFTMDDQKGGWRRGERSIEIDTLEYQQTEKIETELEDVDRIRIRKVYACCPGWHSGGS
jgi:hypothetical protein